MHWNSIDSAPKTGKMFVIRKEGDPNSYEVGKFSPVTVKEFCPDTGEMKPKTIDAWAGFTRFSSATHWAELDD